MRQRQEESDILSDDGYLPAIGGAQCSRPPPRHLLTDCYSLFLVSICMLRMASLLKYFLKAAPKANGRNCVQFKPAVSKCAPSPRPCFWVCQGCPIPPSPRVIPCPRVVACPLSLLFPKVVEPTRWCLCFCRDQEGHRPHPLS